MKKESVKVKETDYWYCDSCKIDNTGKRMCPCPRGSCEAEPVGKIITTTELKLNKPNQENVEPVGDVEEMYCRGCQADTGHHVIKKAWTCVHCGTKK